MENQIITIIIAVLSSGLVQFFFNKFEEKHSAFKKIHTDLNEIKKVATRTNFMMLLSDYPDKKEEIMKVAHLYFEELKGNYYLSTLFEEWLEKNNISKPFWFKIGNV